MNNAIFNGETDAELMLRLADLMEQGSQDIEQVTGMYFVGDGVCAMGAVLRALGVTKKQADKPHFSILGTLGIVTWPVVPLKGIPELEKVFVAHNATAPVPDVIIHLNDRIGWDFTHIIAWLRETAAKEAAK